MKKTIYSFNSLLRMYNKYRKKLKSLQNANKNEKRQLLLQSRIAKLYERLLALKASIKLTSATAGVTLGLLAFAPQNANAQITFGVAQTNPFTLADIGDFSSPTFADLDNDGDLDMLAGDFSGNFRYFQNTGTATAPAFTLNPTINPFGLADIGDFSNPTFADLDNDGDMDMLAGENYGNFRYFQNTGTASAPAFTLNPTTNPFGLAFIGILSSPTFTDLDNDGDMDVLAGEFGGNFRYFQNTGTATAPAFTLNPHSRQVKILYL